MNIRKFLYGSMGLLSLLGFIGLYTGEKGFLPFFAFAIDFEYWFMKTDEMFEEYMNKSASRGFYCGMIAVAVVTLISFFFYQTATHEALKNGLAYGWGTAIIVYAFSTAFYVFKEQWGSKDD